MVCGSRAIAWGQTMGTGDVPAPACLCCCSSNARASPKWEDHSGTLVRAGGH